MSGRILEVLRQQSLIGRETLERAVEVAARDGIPFLLYLLENGLVDEARLLTTLSDALGIEAIDLDGFDLEAEVLAIIPRELALQHRMIALMRQSNGVVVAMGDPTNLSLTDMLSAKLGTKLKPRLASELAIQRALERYYIHKNEDSHKVRAQTVKRASGAPATAEVSDTYVVSFVDTLMLTAAQRRASDIHIEPFEKALRVRLRIDGILLEYENRPRFEAHSAILSRIKILSGLDIAERRLPQDGATKLDIPGIGTLDFRVSTMPTVWGESAVLRLLDKTNLKLDLTKLGFEDAQLALFREAIERPHGMVLVTGPTGSGKTTTLYSALNELNRKSECVLTAEDPVEYTIAGIRQLQVRHDIGLTFAEALKTFLRQDPDVIMVGEIRDHETAEIALRAALTGHVVLSTLHTNNAAESVERLRNLGVNDFNTVCSINAVIAQRLMRKICSQCKEGDTQTVEALITLGLSAASAKALKPFRGRGCAYCNGTGYKGRTAIYEVLSLKDAQIRDAISQGTPAPKIHGIAILNGMQTLRHSAWKKVAAGISTVAELADVTASDAS